MSKSNTFENDILLLIFNNTNIGDLGDATGVRGSTSAGSLFVALFTTDPGEAGGGIEATFGAYARVAVARSVGGWTVTNNQAVNAAEIAFPEATSGSETITHVGIMDSSTGGTMLYHSALDTSRLVNSGTTLKFSAGQLTITED